MKRGLLSLLIAALALLPARAGDVIRPYLVARTEGLSAASVFATVVMERALDLVAVLTLLASFVWVFDGRAILPPMPWMDFATLPEADLKSLYAFLKAIPSVRNPVPAHKVPEPVYAAITENFEKLKKAMMQAPRASKP